MIHFFKLTNICVETISLFSAKEPWIVINYVHISLTFQLQKFFIISMDFTINYKESEYRLLKMFMKIAFLLEMTV